MKVVNTLEVCEPEQIWQMVDEMLVAQAEWLPQYRANGEVARAKKRLATCRRVKLLNWKGAARLKTKTVAELRKATYGSTNQPVARQSSNCAML